MIIKLNNSKTLSYLSTFRMKMIIQKEGRCGYPERPSIECSIAGRGTAVLTHFSLMCCHLSVVSHPNFYLTSLFSH